MAVFLVPKDTIDLIVTTAVIGALRDDTTGDRSRFLARRADEIGQQLWDTNYASVNRARGSSIPTPSYQWEPVFDLIWQPAEQADYSLTTEQTLQVERSRLFISENSREALEWETSESRTFLEQLGAAVQTWLRAWPIGPGEDPGVLEFVGLSQALPAWTRTSGFPASIRAEG